MHRSCDGTLRNKVSGKFHGDTVRYYCCSNRIEKSLERISQVVIGFFCKLFSLFSLLLSLYDLQPKDWRMTCTRLYAASSFQRQYKIGKINISINFEFTLSALFLQQILGSNIVSDSGNGERNVICFYFFLIQPIPTPCLLF